MARVALNLIALHLKPRHAADVLLRIARRLCPSPASAKPATQSAPSERPPRRGHLEASKIRPIC
eukprot:4399263-Lingulodinium_polyedra.AAC.1